MNSALYRIRTVLTLLFFTMFLSACFDNKEEDGPISLEIRPSGAVLIPAETRQFTAIAKHKNGNSEDVTSQVNWSSGDIAIATIDTTGLVTGITVGETAISANLNDLSSTTSLFVDPVPTVTAVTIAPLNPEIPDGGTLQMSAMNRYSNGTSSDVTNSITWGTNNSAIATVDANGLVTATGIGSTEIYVVTDAAAIIRTQITVSAPISAAGISVSPINPTIFTGSSQALSASIYYPDTTTADISSTATWTSSDTAVATVNANGVVTALSEGSTTIQAVQDGYSGSTDITVERAFQSLAVTPLTTTRYVGESLQYTATVTYLDGTTADMSSAVSWSTSSASVATVSATGLVSPQSAGSANIAATYLGVDAVANISVLAHVDRLSLSYNGGEVTQYLYGGSISGLYSSYDHTKVPMQTFIELYGLWDGTAYDTELHLYAHGNTAGTYTIGTDASARLVSATDGVHIDDGVNASGTITIDRYGAEFELIWGSYDINLCKEGLDCSLASNRVNLAGSFVVSRGMDWLFYSEGSLATPNVLVSPPPPSPNIVAAGSASYYRFSGAAGIYIVELTDALDDVTLNVYSDSGFTTLICSSASGIAQETCAASKGTGDLYIEVVYEGLAEGATYNLRVKPTNLSVSVNSTTPVEYLNGSDAYLWTYYKRIVSPMELSIELTHSWNNTTLVWDGEFKMKLQGTTAKTYTIGTDATASYKDTTNGLHVDDGSFASGTITVDQYGAELGLVHGSYDITLCADGVDCSNSANRINLVGTFSLFRDVDYSYYSDGSISAPGTLESTPPELVQQMVASASSSYYRYATTAGNYVVVLENANDDVTLNVYSDSSFTTLLCSSTGGGAIELCGAATGSAYLYVEVVYSGLGEGATYDLHVERASVSVDINSAGPTTHYDSADPYIMAAYDHILVPMQTQIKLTGSWNNTNMAYDLEMLLSVYGNTTGTYDIGTAATASYKDATIGLHVDDGSNANGSIVIDYIGPEGGLISGSYNINLCPQSADCSVISNRVNFAGSFKVVRNYDFLFYSNGTIASPATISDVPPVSLPQLVASGTASYYKYAGTGNNYVIDLSNATGDVDMEIYSDAGFTTLVCSSSAGTNAESCASYGGNIYVKVIYVDTGEGASYDLVAYPQKITINIDSAGANTYSSNGSDNIIMSAYDHTLSPMQTQIKLMHDWNTGTFVYDGEFVLSVEGNTAKTYTLGTDATASYTDGTIGDYVDDGTYASGTITVDKFQAETNLIKGSYDITLCASGTDCSVSTNLSNFVGVFEVHRDYDFLFYSAGSAASPVSLGTAPYNTASGLRDMVASGSDSFYKISVSTSTSYTIDLGTLTDNADLYVYDDLAMTNLLCSSVNTGTTAESCIANSGGAAILYIKVVYSGTGEGAAFDMGVN